MAARCSVYRGAGTDANVTIALHGTKGFVGATRIENAADNFERNHVSRHERNHVSKTQAKPWGQDTSGTMGARHEGQKSKLITQLLKY